MSQFVYEQLYKKLNKLIPNLDKIEAGDGIKLKADGFMDLSIDVLWREEGKTTISMTHYYKQNGDLVPDPDMEIAMHTNIKMAEALSYQDSFGYRRVYHSDDMVDLKAKKELNSFLNKWLNNLEMQGHQVEGQSKGDSGVGKG